ncbi:hypothetical protein [Streptomyces mirabilis]|uniref:hypothetical protein n=1 Tax=Streptomyces mirabilis TaxID=68239 RepID=UPI0036C78127
MICFRPGHRAHLVYRLHVSHGRRGEPKTFAWDGYRDLSLGTHQVLGTPLV